LRQLGKQANCQVAVTLSLANHHASLPAAYRLYLPNAWAEDDDRRAKAGVPEEITFKTKPQIALEQIRWACEVGLPQHGAAGRRLRPRVPSCARVSLTLESAMWPHSAADAGVEAGRAAGRAAPKKGHRDAPDTISVKDLALGLRKSAWRTIQWREGSNEWLSSRFARLRVSRCIEP